MVVAIRCRKKYVEDPLKIETYQKLYVSIMFANLSTEEQALNS